MKKFRLLGLTSGALTICTWLAACASFSTIGPTPTRTPTTYNETQQLHVGLVTIEGKDVPVQRTTVVEQRTSNSAIDLSRMSGRVNGFLYYLPKGRILITGDFGSPPSNGSSPKSPASTSPSSPSPQDSKPKKSELVKNASSPSDGAQDDSSSQKNFTVTIAADIEADPSARYYLTPDRNYFYDDDIHLTVNAKHLLSTGNATATDETAQIIATTTQLASEFIEPGTSTGPKIFMLANQTVQGLLDLIESAVWSGKVLPSATFTVTNTVKQLLDAFAAPLAAVSSNSQASATALLSSFSIKGTLGGTITLQDVRGLLLLLAPEAKNSAIDRGKAKEFFDSLQQALNPTGPSKGKPPQPKPFSIVFDPEDRAQTNDGVSDDGLPIWNLNGPINGDLAQCMFDVQIEQLKQPDVMMNSHSKGNRARASGIVFRSVTPYRVRVKSRDNTSFYIRQSQLVFLPDTRPGHELILDYSRMPFVKKVTNITFVDGIPQDFSQTVPSPALGFLAIPKAILQAVFPLPSKSTSSPTRQGNAP